VSNLNRVEIGYGLALTPERAKKLSIFTVRVQSPHLTAQILDPALLSVATR